MRYRPEAALKHEKAMEKMARGFHVLRLLLLKI